MAGELGRPTVRSRQVAAELRSWRKASGLTTGEVGKRLGVSQSKISRIENNQLGLDRDEVSAMLGLYSVPMERRQQILETLDRAAEPGWVQVHRGGLPDQWQVLIDWETKASTLRNYEPLGIPGLLQTADYARAIISNTAETTLSDSELDAKVAARLGRQGILSRTLPPALHVLLYEPALRMPVGSPQIMAAQLQQVLELAKRPRVTVQVVPLTVGPHPGLEGPFLMMDFDEAPSTLIYVENKAQSILLEERPHIEAYNAAWDKLLGKALTPKRSVQFTASLAAKARRPAEEQE